VKVGDLVKPRLEHAAWGIGVVINCYLNDDYVWYYYVSWRHEKQNWWAEDELELISEK
jgi:hypothetical protein